MSQIYINSVEVSIYRVGFLRDLFSWRSGRWTFKQFWGWFKKSWRNRNYWNGYIAESENKHRCGTGWTEAAAIRSWKKIPFATTKGDV